MSFVEVSPEILEWAAGRAGFTVDLLRERFPKLPGWMRRESRPTLKQLEEFARATRTPVGYLFLKQPPEERLPIPDYRASERARTRPSADLLDTIYLCQQRQEWFRDFARNERVQAIAFVGSARLDGSVEATAAAMRTALGFDVAERKQDSTWTEALRRFIAQAGELGVLVMVAGVVGSNNKRKLDAGEFRGFALADPVAPVIFINGADSKAGQMFTLAHELAHIALGQSALSDAQPTSELADGVKPEERIERWCNQVAAELLVPLAVFREAYRPQAHWREEAQRLARVFKVSTLVVLRRMYDAGGLSRELFWERYQSEVERLRSIPAAQGGDFYLTLGARVSKRFSRAVVTSTLEGRSSFTEAFRLLGFRKMATFRALSRELGVSF